MRPITIIGGGLAGLSLAIALRRNNVPVHVKEAGHYPRHRVCGEFISGLEDDTIEGLGLAPSLAQAVPLRKIRWFDTKRLLREDLLPREAKGISRWKLDHSLAEALIAASGELETGSRSPRGEHVPGLVDCGGRQAEPDSRWMGLKCHVADLPLEADLEMHMSACGYVGISRIEGDQVNICGLFHNARLKPVAGSPFVFQYLRHCGFQNLLGRLERASPVAGSQCSVAALGYKRSAPASAAFRLGDARGLIPPFTGNGMTLAFQSAALAVEPLRAFSYEEMSWGACSQNYARLAKARFTRRLAVARGLHRWLVSPKLFPVTSAAARSPLFPFQSLFRLTR